MNDFMFVCRQLLKNPGFAAVAVLTLALGIGVDAAVPARGTVGAEANPPKSFPHRIWAACDVEGRTPDYGWFGPAETNNIPRYPGNRTALGVSARPYQKVSAVMTGINPVPGPRIPNRIIFLAAFDTGEKSKYWPGDFEVIEKELPSDSFWRVAGSVPRKDGRGQFISLQIEPPRPVGEHTKVRFRYFLTGTSAMTVQIFDATAQDNRHIRLANLKQGAWTTLYLDFNRDSHRNEGTDPSKFTAGNLVDDLFFFLDGESAGARLLIDEVVLFDAGIGNAALPRPGR